MDNKISSKRKEKMQEMVIRDTIVGTPFLVVQLIRLRHLIWPCQLKLVELFPLILIVDMLLNKIGMMH
ncbi:hypothetical protein ATX39_09990 [Oenococcus oeni]|nr:hypothetical protein ATX39_09990 [Oenococcus oeni]